MIENLPLITIGMTSFNAQATIAQAIRAALVQDYPNFELLIIDDCSEDGSPEIIRGAIEGRDNARLIVHEKNTGFAGALNTIIENARGEFIAIFDDDDISHPARIRQQYERITEYEKTYNTDLVLCHVARSQTYENGYERYEKTIGTEPGIAPNGRAMASRVLYGDLGEYGDNIVGSCANCARMGRVKIFRDLGGFDDTMRRAEDTDFSIRFALAGGHFPGISAPLVHQTMTTGHEKTLDAEYKAETTLLEKHRAYLEEMGWYEFMNDWIEARYAHYRNDRVKLAKTLAKIGARHPVKLYHKLRWALPAKDTRNSYKDWHAGKFSSEKKEAA